ncbi:hypothetical protein [Kribbella kalugense]|uniref:Uncharacterized protein n=1 Tax=Kribbella kalugense TaxID=2512221 RepID=A0A4R7ZGB4_9ACTN|nr:hypothetical protein [Kribbella kalugense]TDW15298.1 hypothetical protein EV650_6780 [Kribbella kalugense]
MNRAQLAMAYQACEIADLATFAVTVSDPTEALAQAARVLAAAHQLLAAADSMAAYSVATDSVAADDFVADADLVAEADPVTAADLAAADPVAADRPADHVKPTDPLQLFAYEHPEEAAADISEWLRSRGHDHRDHDRLEGAAAPAPD